MEIKSNINWDDQKKKLQPSFKRFCTSKGAVKIQEMAAKKCNQSDAPPNAKENADRLLFSQNGVAAEDDSRWIRDAVKVITKDAIRKGKQVLLRSHGFHYFVQINNKKEFRTWLIEGLGKVIYGKNATIEDIERIIHIVDTDFAGEEWEKISENYLYEMRGNLFDKGKNCFPLKDVVAVVEDGEIRLTSYSDCDAAFKYQINADFDEIAEGRYTRLFLTDFLGATEEEDPAAWDRFWEQFSYLMVSDQSAKCIIIWFGLGDDGKSTLIRVIGMIIIPNEAVSNNDVDNTTDAFGLSSCHDAQLVVLHETNSPISAKTAELWKKISGDDGLTVNRKHRDKIPAEGRPKVLVTTNHFPTFKHGVLDRALENRLEMLQVYRPNHAKDPKLKEKLFAERDYIVTQAIKGYARLQKNNYEFTQCKKDTDLKELVLNGDAAHAFLEDCADPACLEGPQPGVCTHASDLRERFKNWKRATGEKCTYRDLRATLLIRGFQYGRIRASSDDKYNGFGAQPRVWRGLKLK